MIGIIPAAGRGTRTGGLPYPKELLPVKAHDGKVMTVIEGAILQLANAEIPRAVIVIRPEKYVIADYLGNQRFGVNLTYVFQETMNSREGLPDAVLAGRVVRDDLYVMLMGDTYFTSSYVAQSLIQEMKIHDDAVAGIGTWFTFEPERFGIVHHEGAYVLSVEDKPKHLSGAYEHWGIAAFRSGFWKYLECEKNTFSNALSEAASRDEVVCELMCGRYLDFGTPEAIIDNIKVANT